MRTLVVAYEYPWPTNSGSRIRLVTAMKALARVGPVDLFSIVPTDRSDFGEPDELVVSRTGRVAVRSANIALAAVRHPGLPAEIPLRDLRTVSRSLARFITGTYDLVWYFDVRAWLLAGVPVGAVQVIDLIDLEDEKIRARLGVPTSPALTHMEWRRWPGRVWSRLEAQRWTWLYRRASRRVAATVACSSLDAARASSRGLSRMRVIVNTYPRPARPVGRESVGSPPTLLFQGTMRYPPNADAARWFVKLIMPLIRDRVPDAELRLVGLTNPVVEALRDVAGVTVLGQVTEIESQLERADVVVVPLRFGSGTRLKILEAFAHRIPVVSTTLGAEGLDAQGGRHLLIADSVPAMAEACIQLLTDLPLRRRLVQAAYDLYLGSFQDDVAFNQVDDVVRAVEATP